MTDSRAQHKQQATFGRNVRTIGGATLISRMLGFARDCIIASLLGVGPLADAFFVAFRIPNLTRRLFGEGSLTLAQVAQFAHQKEREGLSSAFATTRALFLYLIVILGGLCAFAMWQADALTALIAPGFLDTPELFARTTRLVRLCLPYSVLICTVALCMGVLNASGHFLAPALAPVVLNLCLICGGITAWLLSLPLPESLAISLLAAGLLQVALQMPFVRRIMPLSGPCSWKDKGARQVARKMGPTVFGAAGYQLSIVITTLLASMLAEGSISMLYYADRLVQFPLGVFGTAIGTAALPALATLAASGDKTGFTTTLGQSIRLTLFISLPAAAGLAAMGDPIVTVLFERGAFSTADAQGTVAALAGYSCGLPAFAMLRPMLAAFNALQDTRTPVVAGFFGMGITLFSALLLMPATEHIGLALAVAAGAWANLAWLWMVMKRNTGTFYLYRRAAIGYIAGAGAVWGAAYWAVQVWGTWAILCIPMIALAYATAAVVTGSPDARLLLNRSLPHEL